MQHEGMLESNLLTILEQLEYFSVLTLIGGDHGVLQTCFLELRHRRFGHRVSTHK